MRSILIRWRYWLWLIERDHSDEACAFFWAILSNDGREMRSLREGSATFEEDIMPVVKQIRRKVDGEE
jgi:hypothetical protein